MMVDGAEPRNPTVEQVFRLVEELQGYLDSLDPIVANLATGRPDRFAAMVGKPFGAFLVAMREAGIEGGGAHIFGWSPDTSSALCRLALYAIMAQARPHALNSITKRGMVAICRQVRDELLFNIGANYAEARSASPESPPPKPTPPGYWIIATITAVLGTYGKGARYTGFLDKRQENGELVYESIPGQHLSRFHWHNPETHDAKRRRLSGEES